MFDSPMVQIGNVEIRNAWIGNDEFDNNQNGNFEFGNVNKILGLSYTNTPCVVKNITLTLSTTSL